MANIAKIKKYCISNGEGLRTAIFFSGCDFHCKGCFNYKLQNPNYGEEYTETKEQEIFNSINEHISGISILGGEPLSQYNLNTVTKLCVNFKENFPNKTIWLWTGYTLEDIKELSILKYIDILIDVQFKQDKY